MSVRNIINRFFLSLGAIVLSVFLTFGVISTPVFADPVNTQDQTTSETTSTDQSQGNSNPQTQNNQTSTEENSNTCYDESGSLGWLVCPTTGFLARVTDGLYEIIQQMLVINPLTTDSDSPYHQIWSIFRDITNVIFAIFFLIIIFSQVSGFGISNYGIKKLLPKIIVSAILINLSYIICAALVDVSNILGASLKGLFSNVEQSVTATGIIASAAEGTKIDFSNIVSGLIGGGLIAGLAVGASGGLGAIFFSLLPVLLTAVFAVAIAYVTIAARQAFVYLLIMVSPLAFVCNLLPNTEKWFTTWKKSLSQMLFFYPMFAVLFGACSLVGWTIIAAAEDVLVLIMGIAVKVIPLIACWPLLKMSGTLPGQINSMLTKFSSHPVGALRNWSADEVALRRAKYLGGKPHTWQYARQFGQTHQDRKVRTASDTQKYLEVAKLRGAAYASELRNRDGRISKRGRELTSLIAQNSEYQRRILKNDNDAQKGLSNYATNDRERARLKAIDMGNVNAADALYYETTRGEKIRFDNAQSRQDRIDAALNAHSNATFNATRRAEQLARSVNYGDLDRYHQIASALEGDVAGTHLVGANAAADFESQTKVLGKKFYSYFSAIPATQELYDRLFQLTGTDHIAKDIDPIITGLTALNLRGDTDLVTDVVERMLDSKQIKLGTHASQSLSNFCMFTTKDSDPFLRRFGKYINLETARVFNEGQSRPKRQNTTLSLNEYITGRYDEYDEHGRLVEGAGRSKLSLAQLVEGTPLDKIERTYFDNMAARIRNAYIEPGTEHPDPEALKAFKKKMGEVEMAMAPAYISAMLKYASGSEQIVNGAADLTGLKRGKDGEWIPRWTDPKDPFFGVDQQFFAERVKNYLKWQTPSQILGLRTDVFYPIIEALGLDYAEKLKKHAEDPAHNPDPIAEIAPDILSTLGPEDQPDRTLPDWYSQDPEEIRDTDSDAEKERKERDNKDLAKRKKALRKKFAKVAFMNLLYGTKTLDQVMTSRRSGVAAGTKASVRDFLGLDSEDFVDDYRDKIYERRRKHREDRERKKEHSEEEETTPEPGSESGVDSGVAPILTPEQRGMLKESIRDAFNADPDGEHFYEDSIGILSSYGLKHIVDQVRDHHERNNSELNDSLLDFILRCIDDDSNF
ncbi:hypothetical protein IK146_01690 [Candidatus Saccharibacteria bacterium]|nr:hypothetical protein [Candidatus Saccharibacteria bacterium]